jgi:hypothetical protein
MAMPIGFAPTVIVVEEIGGTVRVALAEMLPDVAMIEVDPGATLVDRPPLLTVATAGFVEVQVT